MPFDGAVSPLHWLIVASVALIVLGPDQLPQLAKRAGNAWREWTRIKQHLSAESRNLVSEFDLHHEDRPGPDGPSA
jgi:Sec-independent protein translocase protein TatA